MNLPRIVVDNSAIRPAYLREPQSDLFDAGRVNARSTALVQAIRVGRVKAYAPPSFYREFLNVAVKVLDKRGGRTPDNVADVRGQWDDLLSLPIIDVPVDRLTRECIELTMIDNCPAADSWYVAAAKQIGATLWLSHSQADGVEAVAVRHVPVKLLSRDVPAY